LVENEQLTEACLYSLAPKTWLKDTVIMAGVKSILKLHPLEPSNGFLPHFFYTRLTNVGHLNPDIDGKYDYQTVQKWVKNKFGKGKKVSDMTTLVVF
jgi:Ulp1 family protease